MKIEKVKDTFSDLKVRFEHRLILLLNFATLNLRMIATSFSLTTFLELKKKRTQGTKLGRSKVVSYATIVQLHKK